jgi:two-component system sensor histidine kinase AdeS
MRWSAPPLRVQLALAMAACVLGTVAIGYGGLTLHDAWQTGQVLADLPADARRAQDALLALQMPEREDLAALLREAERFQPALAGAEDRALAVLSAVAIACGVVASLWLAVRLSRPLEDVAAAARRIAAGDLSARARPHHHGAGEIAQLAADFNAMARTIETAALELRANSAAIAHELRTPLTILRGRLQGTLDGMFATGPAELRGLIEQVDQLGRIVDDLQTVSLAETGQLRLRTARIDLAEEVGRVLATLAPDLAAAGLAVTLDLQPAPATADPMRLRQVILALLDNARQHAASGRELRIETRAGPPAAVLRVLDRGPGFADGTHERAFDRFWRGDASRSRSTGGSGLGLSVVRAIAEAHGASARAMPREGGGAILEVALPSG